MKPHEVDATIAARSISALPGWGGSGSGPRVLLCSTGLSPALSSMGPDFMVTQVSGSEVEGVPRDLAEITISLITSPWGRILAFHGRPHFCEGIAMEDLVFPVKLAKALGSPDILALTTGCSLSPEISPGSVVVIEDHISFFPTNPLAGRSSEEIPIPKLVCMRDAYSPERSLLIEELCVEQRLAVTRGVYVGVQGPMTETLAEYRMYSLLGGSVIGMTLIPEAVMAKALGIPFGAFSLVTHPFPRDREPVDVLDILDVQNRSMPSISSVIREFMARMNTGSQDSREI